MSFVEYPPHDDDPIQIHVQAPDATVSTKVVGHGGLDHLEIESLSTNFSNISQGSLSPGSLSDTGTSSFSGWSGSENASPNPQEYELSPEIMFPPQQLSGPPSPHPSTSAPLSPTGMTASFGDFSLAEPVIPEESILSQRRLSQSNADFSPFHPDYSLSAGLSTSAPAAQPFGGWNSPLSPSVDNFPSSPFPDASDGFLSHSGSASPALSSHSFEDYSPASAFYPSQLNSTTLGQSQQHSMGLGIQIPETSQHSRHRSSPSLEVPASSVGPIRNGHSHSSSLGSLPERDSILGRSRSGSSSRNSPYSRQENLPWGSPHSPHSPHSPNSQELLQVPETMHISGPGLGRSRTVSSERPSMVPPPSTAGLSRHKTVAGSTLHTHAHSRSLDVPSHFHSSSASPFGTPSPFSSPSHSPMEPPHSLPPSETFVDPLETTISSDYVPKANVGSDAIRSASNARRTEGREAKWRCDYPDCYASFTAKHNLTNHMNSHNGVRPFSCELCTRSFTTKGVMERHRKKCPNGSR